MSLCSHDALLSPHSSIPTTSLCPHNALCPSVPPSPRCPSVPAANLSYIEHIFEISRRPDLLTMVVQYRTQVLKISEEDEVDTKLTRIPSAKKYKGETPPLC